MYLTKCSVSLDSTADGWSAYSDFAPNGVVHAVRYVASTASCIPSTATITVAAENTTELIYVNARTASTNRWIEYPRSITRDSTNALIGATSDFPVALPYIWNERFKVTVAGGTSAAQLGDLEIYVEGGNG